MYETKSLERDGDRHNLPLHASPPKTSFFEKFHSLPFATRTAILVTLSISLYSLVSPIPVAPITPACFLRSASRSRFALEFVNSLLSPFLITSSFVSILLGAANLRVLLVLDLATPFSGKVKLWLTAFIWVGILSLRVTFAYVFGRAFGWGHPQWMSSQAIHEVGQGLAPLLLVLILLLALHARSLQFVPEIPFLCASFVLPAEHGGAGQWLGYSTLVLASIACAALVVYQRISSSNSVDLEAPSSPRPPSTSLCGLSPRKFALFFVPLFPALALLITLPPKLYTTTETISAAHLHPEYPNLVSVLLMTAPRPGNPDFLLRTIDSWLSAFSDPDYHYNWTSLPIESPSLSSRLRLIVYTHFSDHPQFDNAQDLFTSSKAQHYLTFYRDPRAAGGGDRLDQRLHVARALDYASKDGNAAYVLLTEDDFPLCDDATTGPHGLRTYEKTMAKLERALVETNRLLPDPASGSEPGHCGIFVATGGSGLVIRNSIASILPSVFLGVDDPQGLKRESLAARGELDVAHDGPDTPDLVIQDCLRGKIPECSMCAPSPSFDLPKGSARMPWGVAGDRYGKSGLVATERLIQRHLGYPESTFPGRSQEESKWQCGWRQPFNGEPDVLIV